MSGLMITVALDGSVIAHEQADTDAERKETALLMSIVGPLLKPIRGLVLEAQAGRQSQAN